MVVAAIALANCGGGDDDGGSFGEAPQTASISGRLERLVLPGDPDAPVGGIAVEVANAPARENTTTAPDGTFAFLEAPSGGVALGFTVNASCAFSLGIVDIVDGSTITLGVQLDCDVDRTGFLSPFTETFQGVVHAIESISAPGSGVDLVRATVCAVSGGESIERLVRARGDDPAIDDFTVGDRIEVTGNREYFVPPEGELKTTTRLRVLARNQPDGCA